MREWWDGFWFTFVPLAMLAVVLELLTLHACFAR
jgi:hypothetical protein